MFKVPEEYRITSHPILGTNSLAGNHGAFVIRLSGRSTALCIASEGEGWEHVSAHIESLGKKRIPTWSEMCRIKDIFWGEEDVVVQYHPAKKDYINNHYHCLHLWKPIGIELPTPPTWMVGLKTDII